MQAEETEPIPGPEVSTLPQVGESSANKKKRKKNKKRKNASQTKSEPQESERSVLAGSSPGEDTTRVLVEIPRLVVADVRLGAVASPAFLYLPPPSGRDVVFVDTINVLRDVANWPVWEKEPPHAAVDHSYRIAESPGKGLGMFATRAIRKGELIHDERPIYVTSQSLQMSPDQADDANGTFYHNAMSGLSSDAREAIMALSNSYPTSSVHNLVGTLRTNYLQVDVTPVPDPDSGYLAVFPTLSRANHSCSPSANYYFVFDTFSGQLYATRNIAEGEEITISYSNLLADRQQRQSQTRKQWNFICTCETCGLPPPQRLQSDQRRRQLAKILMQMQMRMPWNTGSRGPSSKDPLEEVVGWAEAEGLMVVKAQLLLYGSSARVRPGGGLAQMRSTLQRAREAFVVVEGEKSHNVRQLDPLLLGPLSMLRV